MSKQIMKKKHVLNPRDNGGECVMLVTELDNDDFIIQTFYLYSYMNQASITLG